MIAGKHKDIVTGLAHQQNSNVQTSANFKKGRPQLANAQPGMDMRIAQCLREPRNGRIYLC